MPMTLLVPIALFGWIPAVLVIYAFLPPRRAMIVSFLSAWMFLPTTGYAIPGLPDYTKTTATCLGVLLATVLFDVQRFRVFRPRLLDLPMAVWCLCPFASSMTNGLGPYDGLSAAFSQTVSWGLPYFVGRIYLTNLEAMREFTVGLFIGGLVYVPLCLFEVRMSPQLNQWVYGFGGAGISYAAEFGKWGSRPRVFMKDGLTLGMFMTAASLAGFLPWFTGGLKRLWGFSTGWLAAILICTAILCKNMGALVLLATGLGCMLSIRYLKTSLVVYLLIAAAPLYMALRGTGKMDGDSMIRIVRNIHQRRADSLQTRLENENRLVEKAMQQPVLGWGGWGRNRVFNEEGQDITLTDGLWVIALGCNGLVGLAAITAAFLAPAVAFTRRWPARTWLHPTVAPGAALAIIVVLYAIDCLFNAMLNPLYLLAMGGLVCAAVVARRPVKARASSSAANTAPVPLRLRNA